MIINIRGTNGSGKTTLVRQLIGNDASPVDLIDYPSPTKRDPSRREWVEGWGKPGGFFAVGSYRQGCGGMDTIPSFALQQAALSIAALGQPFPGEKPAHILCEGVLASTVAGSWLEFFRHFPKGRDKVLIAYLDTPSEVCLERIRARQMATRGKVREIKEDQVRDKVRAIWSTRRRFDAAGIRTTTLRWENAQADLMEAINGHR